MRKGTRFGEEEAVVRRQTVIVLREVCVCVLLLITDT